MCSAGAESSTKLGYIRQNYTDNLRLFKLKINNHKNFSGRAAFHILLIR